MLSIPVIQGSVRRGRNTPRVARFLHAKLAARADVESRLIDLSDLDLPLLEERLRFLDEPPPALVHFGRRIDEADAVVITTPEYNKGAPAALKNAIDALGAELRRKPVGIATHSVGAFGGSVVLQQLRPTILNLGGVVVPATFSVPRVEHAFDEDGNALDDAFEGRADRFLDEIVWYAEALAAARSAPTDRTRRSV